MKITVDNQIYYIEFQYDETHTGDLITTCTILNVELQPIVAGSALKNRKDVHVKEVGRKYALANALKGFDRNTRAQFWTEYFNRKSYQKVVPYKTVKEMITFLEDGHTIEDMRKRILEIKEIYKIQTEG